VNEFSGEDGRFSFAGFIGDVSFVILGLLARRDGGFGFGGFIGGALSIILRLLMGGVSIIPTMVIARVAATHSLRPTEGLFVEGSGGCGFVGFIGDVLPVI
jgi:hypothetical protein